MNQYSLSIDLSTGVIEHGGPHTTYLHDGIDEDRSGLVANVRSGDYLVTLATSLDIISQLLLSANHAERDNLQKIVNELLYLSSRYDLTKKSDL